MQKAVSREVVAGAGRLPPYDERAERGVLGSILLDASRVIDLCIERGLNAEAFYLRGHQIVFETCLSMHNDNRPVDIVTVGNRLRESGRLDEVGGDTYLEELLEATPTTAHAEYYIDLVYQHYLRRRIIDKSREAIELCYSSDEDARQLLSKAEAGIFEISSSQRTGITPWAELIKIAMEEVERIYTTKKGVTGIPSGFLDLDRILQGFKKGEMMVLAARPSMGKTALALNIVEHVATSHKEDPEERPVAVFSLEMSADQLVRRMLCSQAKVPSHKLTGGYIGEINHAHLAHAADRLMKAPIFLDDTPGLEVLELRSRARRLYRRFGVQLIVVDYLQLLSYPQYAREGRQRETAAISGALKAMAKELKVPVLVISQLSRAPERREKAKPRLSDLRDSGTIEQDADVVCLLQRPSKYEDHEDREDKLLAVLEVAKNRNGPTGEVKLNFVEEYTRFENRLEGVDRFAGEAGAEDFEP
ncbi:MAG TPA: replicative DNA helicase [Kiritimatiellae bacterium]|nr:replicative DNA helicase [Kiritimatiellia bacterium]